MIVRSRCCLSSQLGASLVNPPSIRNRESDNWASFARLISRSCSLFVARSVKCFGYFFCLTFFVPFIRNPFSVCGVPCLSAVARRRIPPYTLFFRLRSSSFFHSVFPLL